MSTIRESMIYPKRFVRVLDRQMAYVTTGRGDPIVFLHGNPTSSFLWRNIIPFLESKGRCIAPDLIGMGDSDKIPDNGPGAYTYVEHRRYLDAFLAAMNVTDGVILIGHDWGSVLAFDWAKRHAAAVRGVAFMEAIVMPLRWDQWSPETRAFFEQVRSPAGERMILEENRFVEWLLPLRIMRELTAKELGEYRRPFRERGEERRPTLTWPRQLPIDGRPADVVEIVRSNAAWLATSPIPKLFVDAEPGTISAEERDLCRSWPQISEVRANGLHFLQEDSPDEIGEALARWHATLASGD
jgi:haloalkane dehalogenase